ncbi:MAG TPA: hypothetical protein VHX16_16965, partial [Chloroflexota bacterium]|nr:hypothetical protein [Chloroflexota bacterium]
MEPNTGHNRLRLTRNAARVGLVMLLGFASVGIYEWLDEIVPRLTLAEPSGAWMLVPWSARAASRADIPSSMEAISSVAGAFAFAVMGLLACYGSAVVALRGGSGRALTVVVFIAGLVFQLQQLDAPALLSSDPYSYLMYGRIAAIHGGNPYIDTPAQFPSDPVLPHVYWRDVPSFYGPLWTEFSRLVALAAGDNVVLGVLMFRAGAALSAIGCGVFIWLILRLRGSASASFGAALWLWNPLVPLEAGMSGHNDVFMLLLLFSAMWCIERRRGVAGGALWAGAVLVKAIAALALPVVAALWLLGLSRGRSAGSAALRVTLGAGLVVLALIAIGRSPLEGAGVGALGASTERYTNSLHELVLAGMRLALGDEPDDVRTPLYFDASLGRSIRTTGIWSSSGGSQRLLGTVPADSPLLIVAPAEDGWTRVFSPSLGRAGYAPSNGLVARRAGADIDASTEAAVQAEWSARSHLATANYVLRLVAYACFGIGLVMIIIGIRRGADGAAALTQL